MNGSQSSTSKKDASSKQTGLNSITSKEQNTSTFAVEVLHQLFAFEQMFHDLIAIRDKVGKPPIRASLKQQYNHSTRLANPQILLDREETDTSIKLFHDFNRLARSQSEMDGSLVPIGWLRLFVSFVLESNVRMGENNEFGKIQAGLFTSASDRSMNEIRQHISAIKFVAFALPEDIVDVREAGFEEDLTFAHKLNGKTLILLGLGPARTINHSCNHNVYWKFCDQEIRYLSASPLSDIAFITFPMSLTADATIGPAENLCQCRHPIYHKTDSKIDIGIDSGDEYDPKHKLRRHTNGKNKSLLSGAKVSLKKRAQEAVGNDVTPKLSTISAIGSLPMQDIHPVPEPKRRKTEPKPPVTYSKIPQGWRSKERLDGIQRRVSLQASAEQVDQVKTSPVTRYVLGITADVSSSVKKATEEDSKIPVGPGSNPQKTQSLARKSDAVVRQNASCKATSPVTADKRKLPFKTTSNKPVVPHETPPMQSGDQLLLQAFLNSQKIVMKQQDLIESQCRNVKVAQEDKQKSQDRLDRYQANQDRLGELIWGKKG
ncbi:uncharacterized protein I303_100985 [Kwoniella dejecticola CBS 10117]|uniref:Uncharacterized protein n=1 Tax=Kwoniella dejecticola CBS 10117 TaxID=1296121 RepID=A0A1A6AGI2_9TREE|nr:uncharacterized protein I303_00990 [Kwoniella dejecticola CBS 10117]OBR89167.1 hypothetical protein I303_00990 [Kwoniella dejecticola CBS 10117]